MGTSGQLVPIRNKVLACQWLDANGYHVGESLPYTQVHQVHKSGSFHYDEQTYLGKLHSKAADINYLYSGERTKLVAAVPVIRAFGCSVIYALNGSEGSSAQHKDHIHLDVGEWSNLGTGSFKTVAKNLRVYDVEVILHMNIKSRNNILQAEEEKRLNAVRSASRYHGHKFPYGIKYTQAVIGAPITGKWDSHSATRHNITVQNLEKLWRADKVFTGTPNTIWTAATDSALTKFKAKY